MYQLAEVTLLLTDPSTDQLPLVVERLREVTGFDVVCINLSEPLTPSGPKFYGAGFEDPEALANFNAACSAAWQEWVEARATSIWVPDVALDVRADRIDCPFPFQSVLLLPIAHPEMETRGFVALAALQKRLLDDTERNQLSAMGRAIANYALQIQRNIHAQQQLRANMALAELAHLLSSSVDVTTLLRLSVDVLANLSETERFFVSIESDGGSLFEPIILRGLDKKSATAYLELLIAPDGQVRIEGAQPNGLTAPTDNANRAGASDSSTSATSAGVESDSPHFAAPDFEDSTTPPYNFPLTAAGRVVGYLTLLPDQRLCPETVEFLEIATRLLGVAVHNSRLYSQLQKTHRDTVRALGTMLDVRDRYSYGHSLRVADLARRLAERIQLPPEEVAQIETAALLHDVGKVAIPESLLQKRGPLTREELERIKEHSIIGAQIVGNIQGFDELAPYIRHHHERIDGTGYPQGLRGDAIPLGARIIAIAEAYDYLLSQTEGSPPSPQEVYRELASHAGTQFDTELIRAFAALVPTDGPSNSGQDAMWRSGPILDESSDRTPAAAAPQSLTDPLTPRELEVLELVGEGLSNAEISAALDIREKTVKTHLNHIYQKLGFSDRLKAAIYIREQRQKM